MLEPMTGKALRAVSEIPTNAEVIAFDGSVRSSKTIAQILLWVRFVLRCIHRKRSGALIIVGKTQTSAINNIVIPMQEAFGSRYIVLNRGEGTVTIFGRQVGIYGANNAEAAAKIQGLTVLGALVDETANVPEAFFAMLLTRLSAMDALLILTTNPDHPKHWLLGYLMRARWWIDAAGQFHERDPGPDGDPTLVKVPNNPKPQPVLNWWRVTFVLPDNTWLIRNRPEFYQSLIRSYPVGSVFERRMLRAEWASADGQVYADWSEDRMTLGADDMPQIDRMLIAGLDYGTDHPTRAYLLGIGHVRFSRESGQPVWRPAPDAVGLTSPQPVLIVVAEFAPDTGTVGQHASQFLDWLERWQHLGPPEWIAVDPAAKTFRVELFDRGVENVRRAHNSVVSGIQVVQSLLTAGRLYVVRDRCPALIDRLPGYQWDTKATDRGTTAPIKERDDEADALRYAVYTSWADWRDQIPLASIRDHDDSAEDDA